MEITEVRIKLMEDLSERLQAFCSITFDDAFVVRDLKIIEGSNGPFVAMPSRKLTVRCAKCGFKNHLRACYCNQCGNRVQNEQLAKDNEGRAKLYADIAHPINSECREMVQERIIQAFQEEVQRSGQPGYQPRHDDLDQDYEYGYTDEGHATASSSGPHFKQPTSPSPETTSGTNEPKSSTSSEHGVGQQKTKVEGPEVPRGPHQVASGEETPAPKKTEQGNRSQFGAGIFE